MQELLISLSLALSQLSIELEKRETNSIEEKYLDKLIQCESGGKVDAVNRADAKITGFNSYGILQFQPYTLLNAGKKYGLLPPEFTLKEIMAMRFNSSFQKEVARNLLEDGEWRHWKKCGKKIGLNKVTTR